MTRWLSEEWFDRARELWPDTSGPGGLSGRVQCEITGGPEGDVSCYWVFEDGRLESGSVGRLGDADAVLTVSWDDAVAVQRGDLDPNVAFMQGRMKVTGSMGVMIDLLSRARSPGCRELMGRMAGLSGW
ncbi:MAG TPA: SCP2 sterol-binding domain-containing protein [Acidimicrobiales bacterium]|nr:SCP2 sterol-binding domain-containing protein [Acidimicrobiales bacterium]